MAETDRVGLRERKKAKTRARIQRCALRLFREQGYAATTMEQIAREAEVSPSTVFHYFPTKPDLVLYDDLDELIMDAIHDQPPDTGPVQMLRAALRASFGALSGDGMTLAREREHLMWTVPEVRASMLDELVRTLRSVIEVVATRAGRPADDDAVVAVSGAVLGIGIAAWVAAEGEGGLERFLDRIDTGMAMLESGFRL